MGGALLKSKTSDEQQFMRVAIDAMEQLALLLRVPTLNVRKSIIQTVLSFWEQRPSVWVDILVLCCSLNSVLNDQNYLPNFEDPLWFSKLSRETSENFLIL